MNKNQEHVYEMFCNVRRFVQRKSELFPPGSNSAAVAIKLDKVIRDLEEDIAIQRLHTANSQKHTLVKSDASEALRAQLVLITDIARLLKRNIPDIMDRFKLPRSESDAVLLHAARSFAEQVEPLKDTFLKYEMPSDFVEDLYTRIRRIEQLLADRNAAKSVVKRSTSNISSGIKQGLFVAAELDVIMTILLRNDDLAMREWRISRHVRKFPRKKGAAAQQEGQSSAE